MDGFLLDERKLNSERFSPKIFLLELLIKNDLIIMFARCSLIFSLPNCERFSVHENLYLISNVKLFEELKRLIFGKRT